MGASVSYKSRRLTFKRDVIDKLDKNDSFEIHVPSGTFRLTKNQFYTHFPNVAQSDSYRRLGVYWYPTVPRKARAFLLNGANAPEPIVTAPLELPSFLTGLCPLQTYRRWLYRKAVAHVKRDKKRWGGTPNVATYQTAIHDAVKACAGNDCYTGEPLDWSLLNRWDNDLSKKGRSEYKKSFWNLPTADHENRSTKTPEFRICSWKINDCKTDLSWDEFVEVCHMVVKKLAPK